MRYLSLLLVGALVNSVGSGLTAFGLGVFAYNTYGTASAVALVQLCAFAPIVLLAPLAGALADRFDRRLMMLLGDGVARITVSHERKKSLTSESVKNVIFDKSKVTEVR